MQLLHYYGLDSIEGSIHACLGDSLLGFYLIARITAMELQTQDWNLQRVHAGCIPASLFCEQYIEQINVRQELIQIK